MVDQLFPSVSLPASLPAFLPLPCLGRLPSIDWLYRAPQRPLPICLPLISTLSGQWANPLEISQHGRQGLEPRVLSQASASHL